MSALGGIYNFDSKPVDIAFLSAFGEALASRGPDGGDFSQIGSIGMVFRAFHTNKDARLEKQPLIQADGRMLCWDGRLDNRSDLIRILSHHLTADLTDVAIVLAAYREWGKDFLPRLIGDFALSLWDPTTRTLLLARDAVGPRPLYYHWNERGIIWSSDLAPLLDFSGIQLEVDQEFIATYLTHSMKPCSTPFKKIFAVPPGHLVAVRPNRLDVRRFWALDPNCEIRYKTDAQYEEHFRQLFREAVACRLRVDGPVWATLSGGLDSSAIVCMADNILESGGVEASRLDTVSYVYDQSTSSDEREFISCVEQARARAGHHLTELTYPPLTSFPDAQHLGFPEHLDCFFERHLALCEMMRACHARVLMTGHGGDEILGSGVDPSPELLDHLARLRLVTLHRSLKAWSKALKKPYLKLLWQNGIIMALPARWYAARIGIMTAKFPPWFREEFSNTMNLRNRYLRVVDDFGFTLPSKRDQAQGFLSAVALVSRVPYRSRGCIEVCHPYLHRPLIEFLQAIPHDQNIRPLENRSLMRRALRGLVPEKVLTRKTKRHQGESILRGLRREWGRLQPIFANARVHTAGYIDADKLLTTLNQARNGSEDQLPGVITVIPLEFWLRALEDRRSMATSTGVSDTSVTPLTTLA
jgi:asparagine synthase (glutamine-hydrolysing)